MTRKQDTARQGEERNQIRVAIIIISYNTRDLLLACLASVAVSIAGIKAEVVVVDNGSADGSADAVTSQFPNIALIANSRNLGFGAACNQGIKATIAPMILLLNSDAMLSPAALTELLRVMDTVPRCGAAGCGVSDSTGAPAINTRNFLTPINQAAELVGLPFVLSLHFLSRSYLPRLNSGSLDCGVEWIDGACLMLRRAALDQTGLFDERFFMYSEDEDLCYRLKQKNWIVCFTARATVFHRGGASASRDRSTNLRHFYESQLLFLDKHRGAKAVRWYLVGMRVAAALKRIWYALMLTPDRDRDLNDRMEAVDSAASAVKRQRH